MELARVEHEQLAKRDRRHVGGARGAGQKRHLAEEIAAPEPDAAGRIHLDGAGRDEESGVPMPAFRHQALAGNGEGRPHQPAEIVDLGFAQRLE